MKKWVSLFYFLFLIIYSFAGGIWTQRSPFNGGQRYGAVGFSIGNKGYVSTGLGSSYYNDLWEWNQATDSWSQKASMGGSGRDFATGFVIGTKGYVATGYVLGNINVNELWEYDQVANTWSQKTSMGGIGRQWAVSFSIATKGYVCGGWDTTPLNDFWEYDQATDTWTQKANFGGGDRAGGVGFAIGTKGYVGLGSNLTNYPKGYKDLWEYNPATNAWTTKANFPGTGRNESVAFTIGQYEYVGGGTTQVSSGCVADFWRYDAALNTWSSMPSFGGGPVEEAAAFSIGCYGYVTTGFVNDGLPYRQALWQYYDSANTTCIQASLPVAHFISSDTSFCDEAGKCLSFSDQSNNSPTSWQWFFPAATPNYSNQQNPTNICYTTPGTYPVTLIVSNAAGSDTLTVSPMISLGTGAAAPVLTVSHDTIFCSYAASYQWYRNGFVIVGATDSFYVFTQNGTYAVQITDGIGCSRLSDGMVITNLPPYPSPKERGVRVYPNPAGNELWVEGVGRDATVSVYNTLGEAVLTATYDDKAAVSIKSLSAGIYFIRVINEKGNWVGRFVKE